jgi:hypothetical protein
LAGSDGVRDRYGNVCATSSLSTDPIEIVTYPAGDVKLSAPGSGPEWPMTFCNDLADRRQALSPHFEGELVSEQVETDADAFRQNLTDPLHSDELLTRRTQDFLKAAESPHEVLDVSL